MIRDCWIEYDFSIWAMVILSGHRVKLSCKLFIVSLTHLAYYSVAASIIYSMLQVKIIILIPNDKAKNKKQYNN